MLKRQHFVASNDSIILHQSFISIELNILKYLKKPRFYKQ